MAEIDSDPTNVVMYLAYGHEDIFHQTLYSILSLLHVCGVGLDGYRVVVYTDQPARFATLPVQTVELSPELLQIWLGASDYVHRRKTCAIADAGKRFRGKIAFIDSDTWFITSPQRIFRRVAPGRACLHICEGFIRQTGTPFDNALAQQLDATDVQLSTGERVLLNNRTQMWNTGVIAFDHADLNRFTTALELSDAIWRTADPVGAYGRKIHHAEQFATWYAFRDCQLSEAADCVFHYWPAEAKRVFGAVLPRLVDKGLADLGVTNLADIYAKRYRERGLRARLSTAKMIIRRVAQKMGIPVTGARRNVR